MPYPYVIHVRETKTLEIGIGSAISTLGEVATVFVSKLYHIVFIVWIPFLAEKSVSYLLTYEPGAIYHSTPDIIPTSFHKIFNNYALNLLLLVLLLQCTMKREKTEINIFDPYDIDTCNLTECAYGFFPVEKHNSGADINFQAVALRIGFKTNTHMFLEIVLNIVCENLNCMMYIYILVVLFRTAAPHSGHKMLDWNMYESWNYELLHDFPFHCQYPGS